MNIPRPNFSGTWRFDPARSTLQIPAPDESIFVIVHDDPALTLSRTHRAGGKADTFSLDLSTDGRTTTLEREDLELRCHCTWEGDALVFHARLKRAGKEGLNVVRYSLAEKGRALRAEERFRSRELDYDNVWVLQRVDVG